MTEHFLKLVEECFLFRFGFVLARPELFKRFFFLNQLFEDEDDDADEDDVDEGLTCSTP